MNIFHKVALQSLLKNRTRTFVTVIGVILSAAMFTAVATFGTSLMSYLVQVEIAKGGNWHIQFSGVPSQETEALLQGEEIAQSVSYENIGYAILEGAGEASADKPYLFLAGFDQEAFQALPVRLISGRLPERGGEVLIPDHIALKAGVRIPLGADLELDVGQRTADGHVLTQCDPYREGESLANGVRRTYQVVGTYARPGFEPHSSPGYTLITAAEGGSGSRTLLAALKNPRHVREWGESRKEISPYELNGDLLRFMGVTENRLFHVFYYTIGGVLAMIIMVGSVFLIYNSFYISLGERVHQFGILMSVGATKRQLRGSVLFEGFCIGIMGIPFGILAGIGSVGVLLPMVEKAFYGAMSDSAPLKLAVFFPALALSAAISLVTILISAYVPVKRASSMPVLECIRQTGEIRIPAKAVRTARLSWKWWGLEGTLALKNFKRNKKRYRGVVLSLTLSVVLAVSGSAFGATLKRVSKKLMAQAADGDLLFSVQDMEENEFLALYDKIRAVEGVTESTWQADLFYNARTGELPEDFLAQYRQEAGDDTTGPVQEMTLEAQFLEDALYYDFVESQGLPVEEFRGEKAKVLMCGIQTRENAAFLVGSSINFTLVSPSGEWERDICAVFQDSYPLDMGYVGSGEDVPDYVFHMTAPLSLKPLFDHLEAEDKGVHLGATLWSSAPSSTLSRIEALLLEEGVTANYTLVDLSMAFGLFRNLNFVIDLFTAVFVTMISLIAVANVFNTVSTSLRLRRRELAMLRSVGMSEGGFRRMMNFECAFYGLRTLMYSLPIATAASWMIYKVLVSIEELDDVAYVFPWEASLKIR